MADDVELTFGSPNRRKTYVDDEVAGIRVPCTEVRLDDSPGPQGSLSNDPFRLYDTSGPGSDPEVGLPALREEWILDRGDIQRYDGVPTPHHRSTSTISEHRQQKFPLAQARRSPLVTFWAARDDRRRARVRIEFSVALAEDEVAGA
jgi:hypothetical protein